MIILIKYRLLNNVYAIFQIRTVHYIDNKKSFLKINDLWFDSSPEIIPILHLCTWALVSTLKIMIFDIIAERQVLTVFIACKKPIFIMQIFETLKRRMLFY